MLQQLAKQPIRWLESGIFHALLKPPYAMRRFSSIEGMCHTDRVVALSAIGDVYDEAYQQHSDAGFFTRGQTEDLTRVSRQPKSFCQVEDLNWTSCFEPLWNDSHLSPELAAIGIDRRKSFREKFNAATANIRCHARRYYRKAEQPRPVLVCLHGYAGGHFSFEERVWPIQETLELGLDLIVMVLPYHGSRLEKQRKLLPPRFPSRDSRFTIEALRQSYFDFAALHDFLKAEGVPWVGLSGMSLGGYCSALIATLQTDLKFILPVTPLGCMVSLIDRQSRLRGTPSERKVQRTFLDQAYHKVHPLFRSPLYDEHSMAVIAGEGDGITGMSQASLLSEHFQSPLHTFPGGHMIRPGFRELWTKTVKRLAEL